MVGRDLAWTIIHLTKQLFLVEENIEKELWGGGQRLYEQKTQKTTADINVMNRDYRSKRYKI